MMHQMKFMLWKKSDMHYGGRELHFKAQYDQSIPEDKKFYDATPSGEITLMVTPEVADQYEVGKYYYFYSDKAE